MPKDNYSPPLGIQLWNSELPPHRPRLREGYLFSLLENSGDSYRFTALASAEKVADIFREFVAGLPDEAFLILEFYPEPVDANSEDQPAPSVYYSPYLPTDEILEILAPYLPRLIHDGFVGFGLANNRAGMEIFYSEEKVLTFFTDHHIRVMDLLARFDIAYRPEMVFPADLGHDHLSLLCYPAGKLPKPLVSLGETELDYAQFCTEIADLLDMYQVEESVSFFLSRKEQDLIEARLAENPDFMEFAEEDFGGLLLDWNAFVDECEEAFQGDLWEYCQGLKLRDMIQYVIEGVPRTLGEKILDIVAESDTRLRKNLTDVRKRLDPPADIPVQQDRFWYRGMVRNQGVDLRRDLIRQGWYRP